MQVQTNARFAAEKANFNGGCKDLRLHGKGATQTQQTQRIESNADMGNQNPACVLPGQN